MLLRKRLARNEFSMLSERKIHTKIKHVPTFCEYSVLSALFVAPSVSVKETPKQYV